MGKQGWALSSNVLRSGRTQGMRIGNDAESRTLVATKGLANFKPALPDPTEFQQLQISIAFIVATYTLSIWLCLFEFTIIGCNIGIVVADSGLRYPSTINTSRCTGNHSATSGGARRL